MTAAGSGEVIALVDCVSFYANAERVFDPSIASRPTIVLSNNDGCVVAADPLAKSMDPDIMGKPWFKIEAWCRAAGVAARSSNYELYGSLSGRVAEILGRFSAWQEIYSVDESFIRLRGTPAEVEAIGQEIRGTVMRLTGIPVRVSIASTKTLAKVAALGIKKVPAMNGVLDLRRYSPAQLDRILDSIPVTDLWGVAGRTGKKLAAIGIHTARDLREADAAWIRKRFSVVMQRTVLELRGTRCIEIETQPAAAKDQLIYSRSFSSKITSDDELAQVISLYAQRVSARLRAQKSRAGYLTAWAATGWADERSVAHTAHVNVPLATPSDDPIVLTKAASKLLATSFPVDGIRYARAGVVLTDLRDVDGAVPLALFREEFEGRGVGRALDQITRKLGRDAVGVGLGGLRAPPGWEMKRAMLSKRTMTHWDELPVAAA
ncbi:Y-family DNA polymerase [Microbacterium gubbeenense]|uniref:Y-family DNA polymerase n=1 Tax=Microbacterium gubbeenense TaxID=159896 RepID=UPI00048BEC22|nr:Y-family DNA polymerase [Microbacterium gubbeenense]